MSICGEGPKPLHQAHNTMCVACRYWKVTRRPRRTKAAPNAINREINITKPRDCISIKQMESPIPGLVAQMQGMPTKSSYCGATICVDHFSDVTYVHLQKSINVIEIIEAKYAFKRWANFCGVVVTHYHATNGRFSKTVFMAEVVTKGQKI